MTTSHQPTVVEVPTYVTDVFTRIEAEGRVVETFDAHGSRAYVSPTEALADVTKLAQYLIDNGGRGKTQRFTLQVRPGDKADRIFLDVEADLVLRISEDGDLTE